MLRNIPDPKVRATYGHILNGDFPYKVYCMEPQDDLHKPGVLIGYMDNRSKVVDEPIKDKKGEVISGIETSRDRLDGRKGFKCYCGNWSIQCAEEQPYLSQSALPIPPSQDDLKGIFASLMENNAPQGMDFVNGVLEYDGFKVEKVN